MYGVKYFYYFYKKNAMPISKSAFRRYKIIDGMLRNSRRPYPTLIDIQEKCFEKLEFYPSTDTLEKDIRNMKMSEPDGFDAPIHYCRKNKGYHYTDPNFALNAIALNDNEIISIRESLELIKSLGDNNRISAYFSSAVQKILTAFHDEFPVGDLPDKIVQLDTISGAKGIEHFNFFWRACKNKYPDSLVHYSYGKREFKSLIVHPVRLKEFENRWYLIAFSEHHAALRTFGLDRIYDPFFVKRKYIASNPVEVSHYCTAIYGVYPIENQPEQPITFLTSIAITNYFEAYPIHATQTAEKNESGSCFFTINVIPSIELIMLFRSYGKHLEVISPQWLRTQTQSLE
jgi:predicted DNA-binding transcriptional regulator YafY